MEDHTRNIPLTASEISSLWNSYQSETMTICGLRYFLKDVECEQTESLLNLSLERSLKNKETLEQFFRAENYPIPQGFTEKDVNMDAPRLFSDKLFIYYLLHMSMIKMTMNTFALVVSSMADVTRFYNENINQIQDLHLKAKELAKEKGIFIPDPTIPKPEQIDFVKKQSFMAGWFGERRQLLGQEISNLVYNAKRNALGQALITGFSQVAQAKEARKYFERGRDISGKQFEVFSSILNKEYITNSSLILTTEVTDSTTAPFSDKLMMFLVTLLSASGIAQYGTSMSTSSRHDLSVKYTRLVGEIALYAEDGANIMIEHGWMEQPPMAADRKELAE
ncbi:DUF3231 family protein [Virgibacillus siamensis]|uniref:DUF3231 family protein n=1 Tax=Virgibacillus siamensis TaxID=480071 RepID=UPI000986BCEC|nr:DUF3231 family protein [Virgibacillus siamensis]